MKCGVLKKGFTINTPCNLSIHIPKGTTVRFHSSVPTITFDGFPEIKLFKHDGQWFAMVYGNIYLVVFDSDNPPYPLSYFKN